jgi:hypothetical protein
VRIYILAEQNAVIIISKEKYPLRLPAFSGFYKIVNGIWLSAVFCRFLVMFIK